MARRIARIAFTTVAAPAYLERRGVPKSPQDLLDGRYAMAGHFFRHGTERIVPAPYVRGEERFDIARQGPVSVSKSTAHVSAALVGLSLVLTVGPPSCSRTSTAAP